MVPVNGIRIIDKQIDNLLKAGIKDIYVVSGYKHDILATHLRMNYPFIQIVENSLFDKTNNMFSLYLTSEYVNGHEFILMNSDVYFDANIIAGIIDNKDCSIIACDKSCYLEESMKITFDGKKINHISKNISKDDYYAVSIDIYHISSTDSKILFSEIEDTILERKDRNSWTEVALDKIFDKSNFQPFIINGKWYEIDNHDDLAHAESIFVGDRIVY